MKLEKREITLNEHDSVKDVFYLEKTLLREYSESRALAVRKETQGEILRLMQEVGKDMETARELLETSSKGKSKSFGA